jgi:hypothetical protein
MNLLEELWRGLRVGRSHCIHDSGSQSWSSRASPVVP